jgi:hypothetical protein
MRDRILDVRQELIRPNDFEFTETVTDGQRLTIKVPSGEYKVGDIIFFAPLKNGNNLVEHGVIDNMSSLGGGGGGTTDWSIEIVPESHGDDWSKEFTQDIVGGFYMFTNPTEKSTIQVELSLESVRALPLLPIPDNITGPITELDSVFVELDSITFLDINFDNIVTTDEAVEFAKKTKEFIGSKGVTLGDLAQGIPLNLRVNKIKLIQIPKYESHVYNDIPLIISRDIAGTTFVDFEFTGIGSFNQGKAFDSVTGDVYATDFQKDFMDVLRNAINTILILIGNASGIEQDAPWIRRDIFLTIIDKTKNNILINSIKIEMIKKIKKCGKRFYRLIMKDDWRSNTIPGRYDNCVLTLTVVEPFGM